MKIDIITIGNSQGVRIPKTIMEQCGFSESLEAKIYGKQAASRRRRTA
jgi:antitoxin MazE